MMHLDTDQALLHHLVASDGTNDVMQPAVTSPAGVVMAAILSVVTLVVVMAMCACREKRQTVKEPGEPMLAEVTPVIDRKTQLPNSSPSSPVEETEVKLTVDPRNSRHSNGSVVMAKEAADNGRPKSHDQRALPDIPAGPLSNGVLQTDDEDEDDGHYDVISRHRAMAASLSAASVSNTSTPPARGLNLYEKVGTGSSDLSFAGAKDDRSDSEYSLRNINPYATVEGIGIADYAHIDEQTKRVHKKGVLQKVQDLETQSGASTDTLNESHTSVPPPPVPDKKFADESGVALSPQISLSPQSSPGLPLRQNSVPAAPTEGEVLVSGGLSTGLVGGPAVVPGVEEVVVMSINPDTAVGSEPNNGKRDPPYSCVTARESLANLRQRQALERQQLQPLPHDATYESVNYDQITSPAVNNLNTLTSDRNSLTSDLYAEIASGSGENSTRSSVYAKVADVNGVVRETPAPTPPPMDFLKHLPKDGTKNEDELPDPGYSIIRRARPVSAHSALPTPQPAAADPDPADAEGQPVYAVVDKSRRNRNTVCVSMDVNENLALQNGAVGGGDMVYAQVNKQRRVPTTLDFPPIHPASAYVGTGARPKVRTNGNNNPVVVSGASAATTGHTNPVQGSSSSRSSDIDPAYQTIPSDDNNVTEPGYEDIMHNQITDLNDPDPNYESVHSAESLTRLRMTSPGVATEIAESDMVTGNNPHGMVHISDHRVDSTFWTRQEHVYQEIGTTQRPSDRMDIRLTDRRVLHQQVSTDL